MSIMSLEYVQEKIKYKFANTEHLISALRAAHRSDVDGIADDGNRGLALMGVKTMEMVEMRSIISVEKGPRRVANTYGGWIRSRQERAKVCKDLGLQQHIVYSVRQHHEEPSPTVLANALSAIIAAIWIDMEEQNHRGSDIVKRISAVMQHVESIVASKQAFGHSTSENRGLLLLNGNGGIPESFAPIQTNLPVLTEASNHMNSFFDPLASLPWDKRESQGTVEVRNGASCAIEPISSYFGDTNPGYNFAPFEHVHDFTLGHVMPSSNEESSTVARNSASALVSTSRENIDRPISLASLSQNEMAHIGSSKVTKGSAKALTPAKRKLSQSPREGTEDDLMKRLIFEDNEKICNPRNQGSSEDRMTLLENKQVNTLSNDSLRLRLLYFTLGSCQSLLDFKEILENARGMPRLTSNMFGHCRTSAESYKKICRLSKTEALCVLLKRCHTVKLFETELACIAQGNLMANVETPSNFSTRRMSEAGNPANKLKATVTDKMMEKIVPGLPKDTEDYKKHRREVSALRRLAEPLHALTSRFGFGILALLPLGPDSELRISDPMQVLDFSIIVRIDSKLARLSSIPGKIFNQVLDIVDKHQGSFLKRLSNVVEPALNLLVLGDLQSQERFQIECVEARDIERFPKGSPEIFECLTDRYCPAETS